MTLPDDTEPTPMPADPATPTIEDMPEMQPSQKAQGLELWRDLLEKDDRTSPEDYPDMALITQDEFLYVHRDGYQAALSTLSPLIEAARNLVEEIETDGGVDTSAWPLLDEIKAALSTLPAPPATSDGGE